MADLYYIWTAAHNPASPLGLSLGARRVLNALIRIHELAKYIDCGKI